MEENNRLTAVGPHRYIFNDDDMQQFLNSPAKQEFLRFTGGMGKSCSTNTTTSSSSGDGEIVPRYEYNPQEPLTGLSPPMAALHGALQCIAETWLAALPPQNQSKARFGNQVFRVWHERLCQRAGRIFETILKLNNNSENSSNEGGDEVCFDMEILEAASQLGYQAANTDAVWDENDSQQAATVKELSAYLTAAFGHPIRLDYGTGHECSFQVLLYALFKLGCFQGNSLLRLKAITLSLWTAYLQVTRGLQTDYMLEPAGSHGVWGLDDYHCLPFYFGACQLQAVGGHEGPVELTLPSIIHNASVLNEYGDQYLYLSCIRYIRTLKKGVPFFEHSPMLHDISQLPTWQKVAAGLLRLFEGEVLNKRQVVQHFVFGNIFQATWTSTGGESEAPAETFRTTATAAQQQQQFPLPDVGPMARAPWALGASGGGTSSAGLPPPTKAPWAK